jgi:hypothetical protein
MDGDWSIAMPDLAPRREIGVGSADDVLRVEQRVTLKFGDLTPGS